jgi:chromosomal replication initiator protein
VSMFLVRQLLGLQLVEIGNAFGGRDHSTVIHSLDRVTDALERDGAFKSRVQRVHRQLEATRH